MKAPIGRSCYQPSDAAPFTVHVQRLQVSPNDGVTLHPITLGRTLKQNNINGIVNGSLKRIGRNKVSLSFQKFDQANSFLENDNFKKLNYKMFIPTFSVTRMGLVRGVPSEWSEEDIQENVSLPIGCGPILKVRRLNRRIITDGGPQLKPTESVVLTFDGQVLPKRIFLCYTALSVETYIFPTIQCYKCCRFGHVKINCRATSPRCYKCGQTGHSGESCSVEEDNISCCLCQGAHFATSKSCLEFSRQKAIKESMAKSCVSYAEASKLHPPILKMSYADALLTSNSISSSTAGPQPEYSTSKHPQVNSYKKTVFIKSKSPPKLDKGYDRVAHNSIIRDFNIPEPCNGCIIKNNSNPPNESVADVIAALINSLSQSNYLTPTNAASLIDAISKIPSNNGQHNFNSVELSERNPQKK
jgi:hypothetical protein